MQFTAVPWMRDHLFGEIETCSRRSTSTRQVAAMLDDGLKRVGER